MIGGSASDPSELTGRRAECFERRRLKTEHALNLVPERQQQYDRGGDEQEDDGEEPEPRSRPLAASLDPHAPAGTVQAVRTVDRLGIDRRLVGSRRDPARWLGHRAGF
jgi:hypothetical protein